MLLFKLFTTGVVAWIFWAGAVCAGEADTHGASTLVHLTAVWEKPPRTCKPHTRWWWPGNALTQTDITWQLEQMAAQGLGGVEIMNTWKMYEKGNVAYLSQEFLVLVKHAVSEAKRLDLEVAITFSPGWGFGGAWVPKEDQSKALCLGHIDVAGGTRFDGTLPLAELKNIRHAVVPGAPQSGTMLAVVAARLTDKNQLDGASLTILTAKVRNNIALTWEIPQGGTWRLMAFWLEYTQQECSAQNDQPAPMVIDHLNRGAVQRYCEHLGGTFEKSFGAAFGSTVDSFFCDSFEFWPLNNAMLWSTDTLSGFTQHAGYDLTKYLPALWFDIGAETPRVRYDLGEYLNRVALDAFFKPFNTWCDAHQVQARIQPHYRFSEELVQGAGASARPETEVTTCRFEPVADPRKATASGARFYGRDIVSAEAYTFIHPARYRTDLQDLKIATDAFLRDGITQIYNHGYFASPELHVAPSRDFPWANRIGHWNTWWTYYHHVAEYVARCCAVLRQGRLVADVLIYSPQATAWSERAVWGSSRRVMPYGNLAKTLVANGYDFDIVNDDLLQHAAISRDGRLEMNGHAYRLLLLPRATVVPLKTMQVMCDFIQAGGTVVALDALPTTAAGLKDHQANDRALNEITTRLFSADPIRTSGGIFLPEYPIERKPFNPGRQPFSVTPPLNAAQKRLLEILWRLTPPDFALADRVQSDGLTFIHKRMDAVDVYFVCNLQPNRIATDVTFRVAGKAAQKWDAIHGTRTPITAFRSDATSTTLPVVFEAWESAFFIFAPGTSPATSAPRALGTLSDPLPLTGSWIMTLEGYGFEKYATTVDTLKSWTESERTRHFSGTGRYDLDFTVPATGLKLGAQLFLDLGKVGTIAEVLVNQQAVGVAWMAPYRLEVTAAVRPGLNHLTVLVTNTLIHYVAGLKTPPEVPLELQPRLGAANPLIFPEGIAGQQEMNEKTLPDSGLLGPVRLIAK